MKIIFTIIFILTVSFAFCQTQADINREAYEDYHKADKELNEVYKTILMIYKSDSVFITNLKVSQRIWIKFRDAELNMMYPEREAGYYGSIQPFCTANYLAQLTRERTKKLKEWITGAEEGDMCSGTIRLK